MRKLWHFGKMCQQKQITAFHQALLIFNFLTQMYTRMVARPPRIGVGPGFDSQGSVILFHKYCIPILYWIHWTIPWWSDSAINSNIQVLDYNSTESGRAEMLLPKYSKSPFMRQPTAEVLTKASNSNHSGYSSRVCRSRPALVTPMVDV